MWTKVFSQITSALSLIMEFTYALLHLHSEQTLNLATFESGK